MNIGDVMQELADKLEGAPTLTGRVAAYPQGRIEPPYGIIGYPGDGVFDVTYGRGMDTMVGVVVVAIGRPNDRTTRDLLTRYLDGSGPDSVKALLDGDQGDYASCYLVRVSTWDTDVVTFGGIDYLAAIFDLEIAGPGTA